jgi:ATP-dependent RNA helicase DeaD
MHTTVSSDTFASFGLSEATLSALKNKGYRRPTDVQRESLPLSLAGKDLVVQSRTGTGKTAAFGIPMVDAVDVELLEVQGLVLTPTRELALQVTRELQSLGSERRVKVHPVYGGESMSAQIEGIRGGAQLIVGTPGRVLDLLRRGELELGSLSRLVLDEADKMLDMGFAQEMSDIMEFVPEQRQTLLFSATIPLGIRGLIYTYLNDPEWVLLSEDFAYVKEVRHTYIIVPAMKKDLVLYQLIEHDAPSSSMIFCNMKNEVRAVSSFLEKRGLPVAMISSDLPQRKREQVMAGFRSGKIRHLVATDVAARGIDVEELSHVYIYSTPDSAEAYIHRAGRTGRIGRGGEVVSLVGALDLVSFNRTAKRYHLELVERQPPTEEDMQSSRNARWLRDIHRSVGELDELSREQEELVDLVLAQPDARRLVFRLLRGALSPSAARGEAESRSEKPRGWGPAAQKGARDGDGDGDGDDTSASDAGSSERQPDERVRKRSGRRRRRRGGKGAPS